MSGEAGGVLVGGVVALAVAPVVIASAATLGLAYGALKVGGFLGKQALDYAAEKKREKELVVGQCSVQLDSLYSQMRSVVRDETNQHAKIVDEMSEQFKQIGLELKDLYDRKPSADELDKNINISRNEVSAKLGSESSIIRDNLISKGRKNLSKCIETIEKSNAEKAELIQWADKTVASVEMQKTAAVEMLRDAEASYRVIESMAKSSNDTNFVNQVRTIFLTLQRSRTAISNLSVRISELDTITPEDASCFMPEDFVLPSNIDVDKNEMNEDATLDKLLNELDSLIGLTNVKTKVHELVALQNYNKLCSEKGIPVIDQSLHMVFTGNPGTGKTVVARLIGKIYHSIGILSQGQLVEAGREDLVGQYVGHTAQKTKDILDSARGGVLFIDEAYTLTSTSSNDYGQEAVDTLLRYMENNRDDFVVIVAGYPNEMEAFISSNPGLTSRFTQYIHFEDYSVDELMQILVGMAEKSGHRLDQDAVVHATNIIEKGKKNRERDFGNGRYVRNLYEAAIRKLAGRMAANHTASFEEMTTLIASDFSLPANIKSDNIEQTKSTEQLLEELDQFIGLDQVKTQVRKMINQVNMNQKRRERGIPVTKTSLHMVFTGNPGTGKTTVARMMGELYKSIGVLPSGQLIEVGREDLVGQYVGQTAQKTKAVLDSALGGVLFIDEAYTLSNSTTNDFGQEAIDTILRHMENERDKLVVIVAGYPCEMNDFIQSNPGLKSRFTTTVNFEDYSIEQLLKIFELFVVKEY